MMPTTRGSAPRRDPAYAHRLQRLGEVPWKVALDVQRPYRWNLQRLRLGRVLDIGCGIGRNLRALDPESVGIDHNDEAVRLARARGMRAYSPRGFHLSNEAARGAFDALLFAHVLEHMDTVSADVLISEYIPYLRAGGKIVFITPQEVGFRSDATHVRFVDFAELEQHALKCGLRSTRAYSFPFPRLFGHFFIYNEFVLVAERSA